MIPEFLVVSVFSLEFREKGRHDSYYRVRAARAYFAVSDGHTEIDHILYVAPVFRERHLWKRGIVI